MADTLTNIANFINSPPGQLAAGGVLAGIVWKTFVWFETDLTEMTKFEIAVWLVGRQKFGPKVESWPRTFAKVFDSFFGTRQISVQCFGLSVLISVVTGIFLTIYAPSPYQTLPLAFQIREAFKQSFVTLLCGKVVADYISLLLTRFTLCLMALTQSGFVWSVLLIVDALLTVYLGIVGLTFGLFIGGHALRWLEPRYYVEMIGWQDVMNIAVRVPSHPILFAQVVARQAHIFPLLMSGFVASVWLWLYFGSGFVLKAARRFDIGFDWFKRRFDIEHKPLSAIGRIAGALVAVFWWGVVLVRWIV
jgi:hypothetical protein